MLSAASSQRRHCTPDSGDLIWLVALYVGLVKYVLELAVQQIRGTAGPVYKNVDYKLDCILPDSQFCHANCSIQKRALYISLNCSSPTPLLPFSILLLQLNASISLL